MYRLFFIVIAALVLPYAVAGEADIVDARAVCDQLRVCDFEVTVLHADEGWNHYANRWDVLTPDGELLATRALAHPHENEQPFTRSLRGVRIPGGVDRVLIRANDSVHGYGGKTIFVTLNMN